MACVSVIRKLQRYERLASNNNDSIVRYKIKICKDSACPASEQLHCATSSLSSLSRALTHLRDTLDQLPTSAASSSPYVVQSSLKAQDKELDKTRVRTNRTAFPTPDLPEDEEELHSWGSGAWNLSADMLLQETEGSEIGFEYLGDQLQEDDNVEMRMENDTDDACSDIPSETKLESTAAVLVGKEQDVPNIMGCSDVVEDEENLQVADEIQKIKTMEDKHEEVSSEKRDLGVKKLECECCGMEEECTQVYEERVRAALCGRWLCGLCEEAVWEERKRLGGGGVVSIELALQAHMQPCQRFSNHTRAKVCPPASHVEVPQAVCRMLCRHLSATFPSPRLSSPRAPASLPRSTSCLPSLRQS
ncbi:hypothetical protein KP509_03G040700 [Ceratopteris richardii]|uniref:Uncharacterized protein n=1 Tax=Ceratopteris richardii TaxID=49495 RepID=A0A8T2VAV0_CERRI|nr:hypothetical protein KP509_03G040700 [Ceratopteris richardii]